MTVDKKYIPLDKSWIIRMGILDIVHGKDDIINFLSTQKNLSDDLLALKRAAETWSGNSPIDVGESGTLYRLLKFASWKRRLNKQFIISGTLKNRTITDNPNIVDLPISELLKLDNHTSQWATASILLGNPEKIAVQPYKLKLSYEAVEHWKQAREKGKSWLPRYDATIILQAETFLDLLKNKKPIFLPEQSEDYCFAYAFGYITAEEGEARWPSLRGHESDRIQEMTVILDRAHKGLGIPSKDHRVVQAITMWCLVNGRKPNILFPAAVNKSWPQFWDFIAACCDIL